MNIELFRRLGALALCLALCLALPACGGKSSGIVDARETTKEELGLMMTQIGGAQDAQ